MGMPCYHTSTTGGQARPAGEGPEEKLSDAVINIRRVTNGQQPSYLNLLLGWDELLLGGRPSPR